MTERKKQEKFRRNLKENIGWMVLALVPYLMIIHWVVVGY